ncbi:hydroxymethylglutaryl-coenzyme A synthase C terminal-domain-containing protein [Polychytrium aggregatum]|uniref:hydroxymethylglutaryl-coenzyme A synthase C terminal-domain-containing protein n=1 Tax=Polychytrium aggregatum TaxID=110093 RepID=UPI0022FDDDBD|nr:hydroxymethylglutaryl-coenzyme A synthase C terminal-domain-containing protein [Polychytrium aggregatum]KAI9201869.1 hydroxymethylglutaryl-coenzyme A synthase C terminal-domain-containing protein [Polychytrium aggregatum]
MLSSASKKNEATNVGIVAIEFYFPKKFVDQAELEQFDGVSAGKYTIGLGQTRMAVCDDREDIHSLALTAVQNLMEKYNIAYTDVGRIEVGTETIIDKSKSVKSVLMTLFEESGNTDIEGIDTTNACYGGTNALFNSINWIESSAWDGRYALVIAGDIAVYASGNARPTGGAGVAAILLGKDAPIVFDAGVRATHMRHVYDFYKADLHSEFPQVDGPLSNTCYISAVDTCYQRYLNKLQKFDSALPAPTLDDIDFFLFHSPYTKLVQKSFGRLAYNDFLRDPENPKYADYARFKDESVEGSYTNRDLEKAFVEFTKASYAKKVVPSLLLSKNLGNSYCGSLYSGLASLLSEVPSEQLQNKRVVLFSYGSGLASSMFSFTVRGSTEVIAEKLSLKSRLEARTKISPQRFDEVMALREKVHNVKDYDPIGPVDEENFFPGSFYLERIDEKFRRAYGRTPTA